MTKIFKIVTFTFIIFPIIFGYLNYNHNFRIQKSSLYDVYGISNVKKYLFSFIEKNNHIPDANNWCNLIIEDDRRQRETMQIEDERRQRETFQDDRLPDIECLYALNNNLSNMSMNNISEYVVLVFEADGAFNQSGGEDLFLKKRKRDQYYVSKKELFSYIIFADGTIAKYRFSDDSISICSKISDDFSEYSKESKYLPLRWK